MKATWPRSGRIACLLAAAVVALVLARRVSAQAPAAGDGNPFANRVQAPDLDGGVDWINTAGPIDLRQLRGKFVVLDFWTYCCINCMHVLPELKKLERAYPNELVVIGVHSAKFATERESENIIDAVMRYEIEHPVVNDAEHAIWNRFGVQSWPSVFIIDPEGYVIARSSGEFKFEALDQFLKEALKYYRRKDLLDTTPLRFELEAYAAAETPLRYPGKLLADEASNRLFIADTNHNRIVVANLDGKLIETIGSGETGRQNGTYEQASFNYPQGMALDGDTLYVADTENHMLRAVDLRRKRVRNLAGTGEQGHEWPGMKEFVDTLGQRQESFRFVGRPLQTALNSPWALWVEGRELYIAMAGPHQIWRLTLGRNSEIGPFAGNGREDIVDGRHMPYQPYEEGFSSFAQPSGLSSDGEVLYVADSEGSSIRAVPFDTSQPVRTIVGTSWLPGNRLFTFGDLDGQGRGVLLQHPLDVLYRDGVIFVADTYNNKIKVIDAATAATRTLAGTGEPGSADNPPQFDEPEGLAFARGKLYVADTNNHRIRVIDLSGDNRVSTLEIAGLAPPVRKKPDTTRPNFAGAQRVELGLSQVKPSDGMIRLEVALELPASYKINEQAPLRYWIESDSSAGPTSRKALEAFTDAPTKAPTFAIDLPSAAAGSEKLTVSLAFYYCREGSEGVCKTGSATWIVPLQVSSTGSDSVKLPLRVRE